MLYTLKIKKPQIIHPVGGCTLDHLNLSLNPYLLSSISFLYLRYTCTWPHVKQIGRTIFQKISKCLDTFFPNAIEFLNNYMYLVTIAIILMIFFPKFEQQFIEELPSDRPAKLSGKKWRTLNMYYVWFHTQVGIECTRKPCCNASWKLGTLKNDLLLTVLD